MKSTPFKDIEYCTDFSENADEAFQVAKDLARHYGATLHILHVVASFSLSPPIHSTTMPIEYQPEFVEQVMEAARESIQSRYLSQLGEGQPYEVHVVSGYASTEIIRLAREKKIGLIVMGSHGLTGIAHVLFGSTADRVVRKSPCSVLTVRLPEDE